jgi:hypothetical protein
MNMSMKAGLTLVLVTACTQQNPPPQYPRAQAQPAVATQPSVPEPEPAAPAKPPEEPLPIAIDKEMPKETLTTNAKLVAGAEATITLDARSDIYSAGTKQADSSRQGTLPSEITLAAGGGVISFPRVIGKASCTEGVGLGADGGDCAGGNTDLTSAGKLSGIKHHQRTMFLVGVFLGPKLPAKAPAALDFSDEAKGTKFAKLEPALGQVFYVGDGKPGAPSEGTHDFVIPAGATRLYLGYADGFSFQGPPGAYGDNKGGLSVAVLQRK